MKEQIHIQYIGLGWVDAHHSWSKGNHTYQLAELLQHLICVVIPLEATNTVPAKAPCNLPMRPDTFTLGTKSADLIALDNSMLAREECVRLNALIERNILEDIGYGDQLIEMQENSWPLERIRNGIFEKIDMCILKWMIPVKQYCNGARVLW